MKEELVNIVNEISEECWKCIDKYSLAGFSRISGELATAGGEGNGVYSLSLTANENGSLALGEDYRRLLIQAIGEYQRFYKAIINELDGLKKLPVLKNPARAEQYPLKGFEFLKNLTFQDNEAKAACEKYYDLAKTIEEINFPALTKLTHVEFAKKMDDIKSLLEGKSVPLVKDAKVKGDLENAPDGIETKEGKNAEEPQEQQPEVPQQVTNDAKHAVHYFKALTENPTADNWKAFVADGQKFMNDVYALKDEEKTKEMNAFREKTKDTIPLIWKALKLLGLKDVVVESVLYNAYFPITSQQLLEMIELWEDENPEEPKQEEPQQETPAKPEEQNTDDKKEEEPKQEEPAEEKGEVAKLLDVAKKLLNIDDESAFASQYKQWSAAVDQLIKKIKNDKMRKDFAKMDKLRALCSVGKILKEEAEFEPIEAEFLKRLHERLD